jgi:hypothetical protein
MFIFVSIPRRAAPMKAELIQLRKSKIKNTNRIFKTRKAPCKSVLAETKAANDCLTEVARYHGTTLYTLILR